MIEMILAFPVDIWLAGEPTAAPAVGVLDGERPKPPSPRFPVWKPRYLDGGVFPFSDGDPIGPRLPGTMESVQMSSHMPPIPQANRSPKGPKDETSPCQDAATKHSEPQNIAEQGETANIKQNTTNKGFFQGRRVK
jgi:hypothetical protein